MNHCNRSPRPALFLIALAVLNGCSAITDATNKDATNESNPYLLDLTSAGPGSGQTSPPASKKSYAKGSVVTVTATPASGSVFTGWRGNGCKQPVNPCAVLMDNDLSVIALFGLATGLQQYDGEYTGTMPSPAGPTPISFVISSGSVQGKMIGPPFTFTGTVSATGQFAARLGPIQGGCTIDLRGPITIATSNGITTATAGGSYTKNTTPTCSGQEVQPVSGSWSATRDLTQQRSIG